MSVWVLAIVALISSSALLAVWLRWRKAARADFIRTDAFPAGLFENLRKKRPNLSIKDCQLVGHALRHFFLAYLKSGCKYVSMPSQITDDLWHELILYTKQYELFCNRAFGHFLHHTPAVVLTSAKQGNAGLRRCWWYVCVEENINPKKPTRLPLLFAVDSKLSIPDGFRYSTDCKKLNQKKDTRADSSSVVYCGGDFATADFDGTTDGFGDSFATDSGDAGGGGCGGGCGGD